MSDAILVTGATGFIGRALVSRLRGSGREVIALSTVDGDIADPATLAGRANGVAHVVHLAGRTYVPESWTDPAGFMRTNVCGTLNVLELCHAAGVGLTFLSAYLYGVPDHLPIAEDAPARPNNPYALSKHLAEGVCRFYAEHRQLAVTVLRPFNVYGPGQPERFLLPTVLRQVTRAQAIEVLDLGPRRDWLYVEDLVDAIFAALRVPAGYNVYNLGSGVSHSVAQLIGLVQDVARTQLPVRSRATARVNEIDDTVADTAKARRQLGWSPRTTLQDGIKRCLEAVNKP